MSEFELKKLHQDSVPAALQRAQHYRLLNEPRQAESICRDILAVEPDNAQALITLVLALTDQFASDTVRRANEASELLKNLPDAYERSYYQGLVYERRATAHLESSTPGVSGWAHEWYQHAMDCYQAAESKRPAGNDDALLRWNTCARIIMQQKLEARREQREDVPLE